MSDDPKIIDGKKVSQDVLAGAAAKVEQIKQQAGKTPCLATVLVGEDPASATYVRMKGKRCEAVGMESRRIEMPTETSTEELVEQIRKLGDDASVHGILLQHPVPSQIDERAGFEAIPLEKDVDGVTATGLGRMWLGIETYGSCTPAGIMRLLDTYEVPLEGREAVVIGRSPILGKPMAAMLLDRHATVTICHSRTKQLGEVARRADVLVAAVGRPKFVQGDWVKEGAVVIDAGYNPGNVGDCDYEACYERASKITPVPGGVGPMTIATLIDNTADAAASQLNVTLS
jgi:methylenetetrahydrofolate dehydrogenase (NADP+)/methenyltetrahydrofolate cyclohydrolase